MFGSLGVPELLIILLIVLIIFGASKLPQLGKGLGQGLRNFKDSVKGDEPPADKTLGKPTRPQRESAFARRSASAAPNPAVILRSAATKDPATRSAARP